MFIYCYGPSNYQKSIQKNMNDVNSFFADNILIIDFILIMGYKINIQNYYQTNATMNYFKTFVKNVYDKVL